MGRFAKTVPGLRDLNIAEGKSEFINAECLRVIATSFRKLEKLNLYYSELITDWSMIIKYRPPIALHPFDLNQMAAWSSWSWQPTT